MRLNISVFPWYSRSSVFFPILPDCLIPCCGIVLFYINCTVESFSNYEIRCSNHIFPEESGYRKIALSNRVLKKGLKPVSYSKSITLIAPVHKDFSYHKM